MNSKSSPSFDRRILALPIAAIAIVALCIWKMMQPPPTLPVAMPDNATGQAPTFELYDQDSKLVKFTRYLGRHTILLAFADGGDPNSTMQMLAVLRENHPALKTQGVVVVAITGALPQVNRRMGEFPFPVLTDLNMRLPGSQFRVHTQWGCYKETSGPEFATFVIDRKGQVTWENGAPRRQPDLRTALSELLPTSNAK